MDTSIFSIDAFYLVDIGEPRDNALRIVVTETELGDPVDTEDFTTVRPIAVAANEDAIELVWDDYIAYAVLNESFAIAESESAPACKLERRTDSRFLAFVASDTFATADYPGSFEHWRLICLNHVVHVASQKPPELRRIPIEERWLGRDGPQNFQR